ncbi:2-dehydro-3-deoxygalactonokinase [uncultured Stenotrophomonas sp.]|uniref:2-dehydro-3-deoxygalactonokinase n=1 Tax=uncultured Stenotrophomonas sp. TaxID=165438 RepID=UPI0025D626D6|nr:2-dehydro-3-deoxygalactonokinase [uncultured Stenotrophomonas sp.]
MSMHDNDAPIIGINWGSSNFRAFLIAADGRVLDSVEQPRGIAGLDRAQMQALLEQTVTAWPGAAAVYACGMVGSNIGWSDAGYADCPATPQRLAAQLHHTRIGQVPVSIVPGLACQRVQDDAPDIMRGEETELLGLLAGGALPLDGLVALPGTHSKWVQLQGGAVVSFLTAMSGEIFDRLTAAGLLASVVDGPAGEGAAFFDGLQHGHAGGLGLGSLLFGARARVIRGQLPRADGASWLRGVLIGAELADVRRLWPTALQVPLPMVGAAPVCALYAAAVHALGGGARTLLSHDAVTRGFLALHRAAQATR